MVGEIEQYLMDKFQKSLQLKESNSSKLPMLTKFKEIETILDKILKSPPPVEKLDPSSIREILYYLNDLLTESQILSRKKHSFRSPQDFLELNNIRTKLNKIKSKLAPAAPEIQKTNHDQSNGGANSSPDDYDISRSVDLSNIHGFDEQQASLKRLILPRGNGDEDDRFKAIAIVGAEGVGKTTLCKMVFNKEEVKIRFSPRVWVSMSRPFDKDYKINPKIAIAKRILTSLGVEDKTIERVRETRGLGGLVCALHLALIGKRYLIVLDDARETDQWYGPLTSSLTLTKTEPEMEKKWAERLGYGFAKDCGGTVIVTSRNESVAEQMVGDEEGNLIPLLPLMDVDNCWTIFKEVVEKDEGMSFSPLNEQDLKKEVLEKCGGVPLGAKMLGEKMREQLQDIVVNRSMAPQRR